MRKKLTVLVSLVLFQACGLVRTQTYLLPAGIKPGWITIEHENQKCPPLKDGVFSQEIVIPESGFLCTSSPEYSGLHQRNYFLVDEKGGQTLLNRDEQIRRETSFSIAGEPLPGGKFRCEFKGERFFYGSEKELMEEDPVMTEEAFLKHHPECQDEDKASKSPP